jgi:hypothetical protein
MWFLLILTLLNAMANNKQFLLVYRLEFGPFPINALDIAIFLGILLSPLVQGRAQVSRHPALMWVMVLFAAAAADGLAMTITNGHPMRGAINDLRGILAVPIGAYLGYVYLANQRTMDRFPAVHALAGVGTAALILWYFFTHGAQAVSVYDDNIDRFRTIEYVSQ